MAIRGRRDTEIVDRLHYASITCSSHETVYSKLQELVLSQYAWVILLCTCYKTKSATEAISKLNNSLGVFMIIEEYTPMQAGYRSLQLIAKYFLI